MGKRKDSLVFNGGGNRCIMREDQANGHVCGAECSDGKDISIQLVLKDEVSTQGSFLLYSFWTKAEYFGEICS